MGEIFLMQVFIKLLIHLPDCPQTFHYNIKFSNSDEWEKKRMNPAQNLRLLKNAFW